jgi:streptogramin lyase
MDKNGNIWFTEILANKIGFFNPSTHAFFETATPSAGSAPYGITLNSRGNIWFTENALPQIANFVPTSNGQGISIKEIAIDSGPGAPTPHLITTDSVGKIWYSEGFAGQVGVYNPVTKSHTDYPVSAGISQTHISGIGVTSNGLVWFNDSLSARIGRLNPATGKIFVVQLSFKNAHPHDGLTIDSSNHVWITEQYGLNLGQIS